MSVDPASAMGPRKADGSLPDITFMHPASGSKLVDAGTVIQDVPYSGSKPDLSCFETGMTAMISSMAPSPSFVFNGSPSLKGTVKLFDLSGKMVMKTGPIAINPALKNLDIDWGRYTAGRYVCEVWYGNSVSYIGLIYPTILH